MLAVATSDIQAVYESQPLLTQVGGFPPVGSGDASADVTEEKEADDAS